MKLMDHIRRSPARISFGRSSADSGFVNVELGTVRNASAVTVTAADGSAAPINAADSSNAGVLSAADKVKLDGLTIGGGQTAPTDFATRALVAVANIDAGVDYLRTAGQTSVGDHGQALYKRVASEPPHPLKVQSADGAWWEIVPDRGRISFIACGGIIGGDAATNGAANNAAFDAFIAFTQSKGGTTYKPRFTLHFPEGGYFFSDYLNVKAPAILEGESNFLLGGYDGTHLRFPLNSFGIVVQEKDTNTDTNGSVASGVSAKGSEIRNMQISGGGPEGTTGSGIWLRAGAKVQNVIVQNFAKHGIDVYSTGGSAGSGGNSNQCYLENVASYHNGVNGFRATGSDANACTFIQCTSNYNGRWGFYDDSWLGNTYVGGHVSENGTPNNGVNSATQSCLVRYPSGGSDYYIARKGATEADLVATTPGTDDSVWTLCNSVAKTFAIDWLPGQPSGTYFPGGAFCIYSQIRNASTIVGLYIEDSCPPPQLAGEAVMIGGHSLVAPYGPNFAYNPYNDTLVGAFAQLPFSTAVTQINAFKHDLDTWSIERNDTNAAIGFTYDTTANTFKLTYNRSADAADYIAEFCNPTTTDSWYGVPASDKNPRWANFPAGIFLNGSFLRFDAARPDTGVYRAQGTLFIKDDPSVEGQQLGWRCLSSGTTPAVEDLYCAPTLPTDQAGYGLCPKSDGTAKVEWRERAKAGSATIADLSSSVDVAFATARGDANYAVALSADGDERIWVSGKLATGFTLNRAGTSGARAVDWTVTPHEDL